MFHAHGKIILTLMEWITVRLWCFISVQLEQSVGVPCLMLHIFWFDWICRHPSLWLLPEGWPEGCGCRPDQGYWGCPRPENLPMPGSISGMVTSPIRWSSKLLEQVRADVEERKDDRDDNLTLMHAPIWARIYR